MTGHVVDWPGRIVRLWRAAFNGIWRAPDPEASRRAEYALLPLLIVGVALMAAVAQILQTLDAGRPAALWRPFFHHLISSFAILAFGQIIARLNRRFPLQRGNWPAMAAVHISGSVVFAAAHIGWTLFVYRIGDALEGVRGEVSLENLHFIYLREAIIYGLMLAFICLAPDSERRSREAAIRNNESPYRLKLVDRGAVRIVNPEDINWISAAKNYVVIHTSRGEYVHRMTLKELETLLPKSDFFRINRSTIISLENVKGLVADGPRDQAVLLRCGTKLRVSRHRRPAMRERLISK